MSLNTAFINLINNNAVNKQDVLKSVKAIAKKLNSIYYGISYDDQNFIVSGSYGRGTFISSSDIDVCYILPNNVYQRFSQRRGNIQSQLLAEIKTHLEERYPNSTIKGDGQVVDALFNKTFIELVPSFKLYSYSSELTYPNTHDNGEWLLTNPIEQKKEVEKFCTSYPIYRDLCMILRCWKDEQNVDIKGIEIDLLVHQFLSNEYQYFGITSSNIDWIACLKKIFAFLNCDAVRSFKILGENEYKEISFSKFKKKAEKAYKKLSDEDFCTLWDNCITLFGNGFPSNPLYDSKTGDKEQFIQQLFTIRITNSLRINCDVSSDGFMTKKLKELLQHISPTNRFIVQQSKSLEFYIEYCDVERPYDIYWKVRNVGSEAVSRNQVRGTIFKGKETQKEHSNFHGPHYVECFIVKDGKCVARDRIDVPII